MALNIKNPEVERLAASVATATGETKTEAIRKALVERCERLALPTLEARVAAFTEEMERDVWSKLPPGIRGKRLTREQEDEILGYGSEGF